jgi:hypothetical protein
VGSSRLDLNVFDGDSTPSIRALLQEALGHPKVVDGLVVEETELFPKDAGGRPQLE